VALVSRRQVSPHRFFQLSVVSLTMLGVVVVSGAFVRLTGSGLGCQDWPNCGDTMLPASGGHAFIEFGNRVVGLFGILATLVVWLAARRTGGLPRSVRMLALVVVALAIVVALEAWRYDRAAGTSPTPGWLRAVAAAGVAACTVMVVTGAVATASGPHPGDNSDVERLGLQISDTVYVHVRATAVYGIGLLLVGAWLIRARSSVPHAARFAAWLLAVLVVQMAVGEIQYRNALPWGLVLVHVALAAAIWGLSLTVAYLLWRPPELVAARSAAGVEDVPGVAA